MKTATTIQAPLGAFLSFARSREQSIVNLVRELVEIESPSSNKDAVDRCAAFVAAEWRERGANVRVLQNRDRGNIVRAEMAQRGGKARGQILVLGHLDTVYPMGTLAKMPFRIANGRAWGPGTFDMKGGVALAMFAADALRATRVTPRKKIVFLWTGDEEIGSEASHSAITAEARQSDVVLVLEPPNGKDGRAKTQRKGTGGLEILIHGRAAHAGVNPEDGVNAVHEAALQIERLMKMGNPRRGITVQANVISGGTATNVVPDYARVDVDVRFAYAADAKPLEKKLLGIKPILKGARIELRGGINRPPLERTPKVEALFDHARDLAKKLRFVLNEASTGGGSDGNFTAAMGVPTLDGIGAVGDGAHSSHEHVLIRALPERAALIAGLLATL